ncbi:MAG: SMI1/KNR4 family protein [Anaerorhabdus sp.]
MKQSYIDKLNDIIDFDMRKSNSSYSEKKILKLQKDYSLDLDDSYKFYLENFGNDYFKEGYNFHPSLKLYDGAEKKYEFNSIFGLGIGHSNLQMNIDNSNGNLPEFVFPIGEFGGGDLICMSRKNKEIYLWFHEKNGQNLYLIAESFESFILSIEYDEPIKNDSVGVKMKLSPELDNALRKAAEKYKK